MTLLQFAFSNHLLNLCLIASLSAQLCKFFLTLALTHKARPSRLYGSGGMPSAHTATVCALLMGTAKKSGYASTEFAICFILAYIVIYDALGVRRAAGRHASVINRLLSWHEFVDATGEDEDESPKKLNELIGHKPLEVFCGAVLGVSVSMIYSYFVF